MTDAQPTGSTPYADVNALLQLLLDRARAALGPNLVGIYLYGSLSSGDFDPDSSDVDFVVATARTLPDETVRALARVHAEIAASGLPWSRRLEGWYLPPQALRRHDPADLSHPTIGVDWDFGPADLGADWVIQRHIVREQGVVVWGPPPADLIDPVPPDELRRAVVETAIGFWAHQLEGPEPEWLRTREYQAFAILTMCRILYTLEHGAIASKPVAAAWSREVLDAEWVPQVERALGWRHDHHLDDLSETLRFVSYTVERCREARERRR